MNASGQPGNEDLDANTEAAEKFRGLDSAFVSLQGF
jgi:hypothetical protein